MGNGDSGTIRGGGGGVVDPDLGADVGADPAAAGAGASTTTTDGSTTTADDTYTIVAPELQTTWALDNLNAPDGVLGNFQRFYSVKYDAAGNVVKDYYTGLPENIANHQDLTKTEVEELQSRFLRTRILVMPNPSRFTADVLTNREIKYSNIPGEQFWYRDREDTSVQRSSSDDDDNQNSQGRTSHTPHYGIVQSVLSKNIPLIIQKDGDGLFWHFGGEAGIPISDSSIGVKAYEQLKKYYDSYGAYALTYPAYYFVQESYYEELGLIAQQWKKSPNDSYTIDFSNKLEGIGKGGVGSVAGTEAASECLWLCMVLGFLKDATAIDLKTNQVTFANPEAALKALNLVGERPDVLPRGFLNPSAHSVAMLVGGQDTIRHQDDLIQPASFGWHFQDQIHGLSLSTQSEVKKYDGDALYFPILDNGGTPAPLFKYEYYQTKSFVLNGFTPPEGYKPVTGGNFLNDDPANLGFREKQGNGTPYFPQTQHPDEKEINDGNMDTYKQMPKVTLVDEDEMYVQDENGVWFARVQSFFQPINEFESKTTYYSIDGDKTYQEAYLAASKIAHEAKGTYKFTMRRRTDGPNGGFNFRFSDEEKLDSRYIEALKNNQLNTIEEMRKFHRETGLGLQTAKYAIVWAEGTEGQCDDFITLLRASIDAAKLLHPNWASLVPPNDKIVRPSGWPEEFAMSVQEAEDLITWTEEAKQNWFDEAYHFFVVRLPELIMGSVNTAQFIGANAAVGFLMAKWGIQKIQDRMEIVAMRKALKAKDAYQFTGRESSLRGETWYTQEGDRTPEIKEFLKYNYNQSKKAHNKHKQGILPADSGVGKDIVAEMAGMALQFGYYPDGTPVDPKYLETFGDVMIIKPTVAATAHKPSYQNQSETNVNELKTLAHEYEAQTGKKAIVFISEGVSGLVNLHFTRGEGQSVNAYDASFKEETSLCITFAMLPEAIQDFYSGRDGTQPREIRRRSPVIPIPLRRATEYERPDGTWHTTKAANEFVGMSELGPNVALAAMKGALAQREIGDDVAEFIDKSKFTDAVLKEIIIYASTHSEIRDPGRSVAALEEYISNREATAAETSSRVEISVENFHSEYNAPPLDGLPWEPITHDSFRADKVTKVDHPKINSDDLKDRASSFDPLKIKYSGESEKGEGIVKRSIAKVKRTARAVVNAPEKLIKAVEVRVQRQVKVKARPVPPAPDSAAASPAAAASSTARTGTARPARPPAPQRAPALPPDLEVLIQTAEASIPRGAPADAAAHLRAGLTQGFNHLTSQGYTSGEIQAIYTRPDILPIVDNMDALGFSHDEVMGVLRDQNQLGVVEQILQNTHPDANPAEVRASIEGSLLAREIAQGSSNPEIVAIQVFDLHRMGLSPETIRLAYQTGQQQLAFDMISDGGFTDAQIAKQIRTVTTPTRTGTSRSGPRGGAPRGPAPAGPSPAAPMPPTRRGVPGGSGTGGTNGSGGNSAFSPDGGTGIDSLDNLVEPQFGPQEPRVQHKPTDQVVPEADFLEDEIRPDNEPANNSKHFDRDGNVVPFPERPTLVDATGVAANNRDHFGMPSSLGEPAPEIAPANNSDHYTEGVAPVVNAPAVETPVSAAEGMPVETAPGHWEQVRTRARASTADLKAPNFLLEGTSAERSAIIDVKFAEYARKHLGDHALDKLSPEATEMAKNMMFIAMEAQSGDIFVDARTGRRLSQSEAQAKFSSYYEFVLACKESRISLPLVGELQQNLDFAAKDFSVIYNSEIKKPAHAPKGVYDTMMANFAGQKTTGHLAMALWIAGEALIATASKPNYSFIQFLTSYGSTFLSSGFGLGGFMAVDMAFTASIEAGVCIAKKSWMAVIKPSRVAAAARAAVVMEESFAAGLGKSVLGTFKGGMIPAGVFMGIISYAILDAQNYDDLQKFANSGNPSLKEIEDHAFKSMLAKSVLSGGIAFGTGMAVGSYVGTAAATSMGLNTAVAGTLIDGYMCAWTGAEAGTWICPVVGTVIGLAVGAAAAWAADEIYDSFDEFNDKDKLMSGAQEDFAKMGSSVKLDFSYQGNDAWLEDMRESPFNNSKRSYLDARRLVQTKLSCVKEFRDAIDRAPNEDTAERMIAVLNLTYAEALEAMRVFVVHLDISDYKPETLLNILMNVLSRPAGRMEVTYGPVRRVQPIEQGVIAYHQVETTVYDGKRPGRYKDLVGELLVEESAVAYQENVEDATRDADKNDWSERDVTLNSVGEFLEDQKAQGNELGFDRASLEKLFFDESFNALPRTILREVIAALGAKGDYAQYLSSDYATAQLSQSLGFIEGWDKTMFLMRVEMDLHTYHREHLCFSDLDDAYLAEHYGEVYAQLQKDLKPETLSVLHLPKKIRGRGDLPPDGPATGLIIALYMDKAKKSPPTNKNNFLTAEFFAMLADEGTASRIYDTYYVPMQDAETLAEMWSPENIDAATYQPELKGILGRLFADSNHDMQSRLIALDAIESLLARNPALKAIVEKNGVDFAAIHADLNSHNDTMDRLVEVLVDANDGLGQLLEEYHAAIKVSDFGKARATLASVASVGYTSVADALRKEIGDKVEEPIELIGADKTLPRKEGETDEAYLKRWNATWSDTLSAWSWYLRYDFGYDKTQIDQNLRKMMIGRFGFDEKSEFLADLTSTSYAKFGKYTYEKMQQVLSAGHISKLPAVFAKVQQFGEKYIWDNCHEYYTRGYDKVWDKERRNQGGSYTDALQALSEIKVSNGKLDYGWSDLDSIKGLVGYLMSCTDKSEYSDPALGIQSSVEQVLMALYQRDPALRAAVSKRIYHEHDETSTMILNNYATGTTTVKTLHKTVDGDSGQNVSMTQQTYNILVHMQVQAALDYLADKMRERTDNIAKLVNQTDWLATISTLDPEVDWAMTYEDGEEQIAAFQYFYVPQIAMMAMSYRAEYDDVEKIREMVIATIMGAENENQKLALNESVIAALVDQASSWMIDPDFLHERMEDLLTYDEKEHGTEGGLVKKIIYEQYDTFCELHRFRKHS